MQLANQRVPDSSDGWIERGAMHANAAGQPVEGAADEPAVSIDQISWCCRTAGPAGDRSGRPGPGCWELKPKGGFHYCISQCQFLALYASHHLLDPT
jgi:hypothetical protein